MNELEKHLSNINPILLAKFEETKVEVDLLLGKYSSNFSEYTDHSINHTLAVFKIAAELLTVEEVASLNADETYILSMACLLHDVGMCIPPEKIKTISESEHFLAYRESHKNLSTQDFIRDIHHQLSNKFILEEWELLKIPTKKYAKAIGLVAQGHRKVDLGNFDLYEPKFFPKDGKEFICTPYLSCILRIADELDVTNSRTPKLLTKYYMPNNEISIREWAKHISTSQRNYLDNKVIFEIECSDQNIYAALQDQFEKIQSVINYCQKVIRAIPVAKGNSYTLNLSLVEPKYDFHGFDPKGIKFSFDVQNVVTAFIGEDLYKDRLVSLREALQNSIDSCRYKSKVLKEDYIPQIEVVFTEKSLKITDNGAGMDEFIIENFFGRLASSFYEQDKIKNQFEAIGQFGVGVFSYFLISEYIDIETKTLSGNALKFRFDKDPKSYFHFFDKTTRKTAGTTIEMHFKENLINKISFNDIENYIRKIFKHIEIPIELNSKEYKSIIEFQPFEMDYDKEMRNRLKLHHKKISELLTVKDFKISNEDFEGTCGLMIWRDYLKTFDDIHEYFDSEQFYTIDRHNTTSQISISQKGVFVNNYNSSYLNFIIGDIDLKKKIKINIDRNEFTDTQYVDFVIHEFERTILEEIFSSLENNYKDDYEKVLISNNFLTNYISNDFENNTLMSDYFLAKSIYVKLYQKGKYSILSIENLMTNYNNFILMSEKEDCVTKSLEIDFPILVVIGEKYQGTYSGLREIFIDFLNYSFSIIFNNNKGYELLSKEKNDDVFLDNTLKIREIIGQNYFEIAKADSEKLFISIWANKEEFADSFYDDEFLLNYNHPYIEFILLNYDKLKLDISNKKIIKAAFRYIYELKSNGNVDKELINKINMILNSLNSISKFKEFTFNDY